MIYFLTWAGLSIAVGLYAHIGRNRNGLVWREKQTPVAFSDVTQHLDFSKLPASEQDRLARKFGHPAYNTVAPKSYMSWNNVS